MINADNRQYDCGKCGDQGFYDGCCKECGTICDCKKHPSSEWVSIKTLPKENGYYLCTYIFDGHRFYYDRWFDLDEKNKFQHGFQTTDPIDFWMPLPPPPKQESEV